ncbi:MAG: SIR2 family protein [Crocosphaera sp.]|nr:SIR2 family protein [Crocosphaera sp.]
MIFKISSIWKNNPQNSNEGLLPIRYPKDDEGLKNIKGNIIFVHGLGGDPYLTWGYENSEDTSKSELEKEKNFWPKWLAEEFPKFGVWSFGHQSPNSKRSWKLGKNFGRLNPSASRVDNAKFLMEQIIDPYYNLDKKPLIFITHSLGGLIVKEMLKMADDKRLLSILKNTLGIVFLATPHKGSQVADLVENITQLKDLLGENVSQLKTDLPELEDLTEWYKQQSVQLGINTLAFCEMYKLNVLSFWEATVVDSNSANPEVEKTVPESINKDHISITKCTKDDVVYRRVKQFIKDCNKKLEHINQNQKEHFGEVSQSLKQGDLIFFIGSGLNFRNDDNSKVLDVSKFPPTDQQIAHELTSKSHIKTDKITGFPCDICPIEPEKRPVEKAEDLKENKKCQQTIRNEHLCPVMQKIDEQRNIKPQLIDEQNLAFAKLQIRCCGQHFKETDWVERELRNLYGQDYICNKSQELLAKIIISKKSERENYPLVITTNYDCGLEKALEKCLKENDQHSNVNTIVVLYYSGDYTLHDGQITRINPTWKRYSYQYDTKSKQFQIGHITPFNQGNLDSQWLDQETLKNHPVLVKLCGGEIYQVSESQWKFAILGINSIKDFANSRILSTLVLTDFCRTHDILFLGYSATDTELQDILDTIVSPLQGREPNSKGWLINQSDIGELNKKVAHYWHNWRIDINDININKPWKTYLEELETHINSSEKYQDNNDQSQAN